MDDFSALIGREVEQVWVWWSLRLVFDLGGSDEPGSYVDLTNFRFTDAAGVPTEIRVEEDPRTAGPVLGLLRRRVAEARVRDRELFLAFATGECIVCPPHPHFEAWAAILPGGAQHFCPPGY
ncbi:DUF6188 family protein [Nocardia sp. NPDC024068]|uniref:DUF6188 family protein n=1 Tax=Nocardia sp. NPDC024068 TaxID=3157197 RepID=UPI00340C4183